MAFTIPNAIAAGGSQLSDDQAEVDKVDLDILVAGMGATGVVSGCAVTAQGSPDMTVAVAAGTVRIGGRKVIVTAGNVTITTANGTNPRFDLITVTTAGTKAATAGTAAANAVFPAIPASTVVLAAVYVPANDTTIATNQITDKRVTIADPDYENVLWYGADPTQAADSTTAFADCMAAFPNANPYTGGLMVVPSGRFQLNGRAPSVPGAGATALVAAGTLTNSTTYYYRVSAWNYSGETQGNSQFSGATDGTTGRQLNVTWGHSTSTGFALCGYKLYRSVTTGANWKLIGTSARTMITGGAAVGSGSGTTLTVSSASGFPATGNYNIHVVSQTTGVGEVMTVTAGQGTTSWTVTRAQGGTSARTDIASGTFGDYAHSLQYNDGSTTETGINVVTGLGLTPSTTGGVLATGTTYWAGVTAYNTNGETTLVSSSTTIASGSTGSIAVNWTAPANSSAVTGYRVYFGRTNIENCGHWVDVAASPYTITGQLDATQPTTVKEGGGRAPVYNTTGMYPAYTNAAGNATIGWYIPPYMSHFIVEGRGGMFGNTINANYGGTFLRAGAQDMTICQVGDGLTLSNMGPAINELSFDYNFVTGTCGMTVAGVNRLNARRLGFKELDVGMRFTQGISTDNAWHQIDHCAFFLCKQYAFHFGDSYGGCVLGGDVGVYRAGACVGLGNSQSWKFFGTFFDGQNAGVGVKCRQYEHSKCYGHNHLPSADSGPIGFELHGCKFEVLTLGMDIDASDTGGFGRGIMVFGCTMIGPSDTNTGIGIYLRSSRVNRTGIFGALPLQGLSKWMLDRGDRTTVFSQEVWPASSSHGIEAIQINGHMTTKSLAGNVTTILKTAASGSTGTTTLSAVADDTNGTITITPGGSGITTGAQATITFGDPWQVAPRVILSSGTALTAARQIYSTAVGTTTWQIAFGSAGSNGVAYTIDYWIVG